MGNCVRGVVTYGGGLCNIGTFLYLICVTDGPRGIGFEQLRSWWRHLRKGLNFGGRCDGEVIAGGR